METRPEILASHNVPKPLHLVSPRTMLGEKWWNFARHLAYSRAGFCCQACGVPKREAKMHQWLEAHEWMVQTDEPGVYLVKEIVALCHYCHMFIHSGRLSMVDDEPTEAILRHGVKIARTMDKPRIFYSTADLCAEYGVSTRGLGLEVPKRVPKQLAWSDYRLRFKEHEWPARFASMAEWQEHFRPDEDLVDYYNE